MTASSAPVHRQLISHFDPKTLTELNIQGSQLIVKAYHEPTTLPKTGLAYWLGRLPLNSSTCAMDIDIGCGLYDDHGTLLEMVWYARMRSKDELVRHGGDSFREMSKYYRPDSIKERLSVRFGELDKRVHKLAFFVHSFYHQPLALAKSGKIGLYDNEGVLIHHIPLTALAADCTALCAWQMRRLDSDWQIAAPMLAMTGNTIEELAKQWQQVGI